MRHRQPAPGGTVIEEERLDVQARAIKASAMASLSAAQQMLNQVDALHAELRARDQAQQSQDEQVTQQFTALGLEVDRLKVEGQRERRLRDALLHTTVTNCLRAGAAEDLLRRMCSLPNKTVAGLLEHQHQVNQEKVHRLTRELAVATAANKAATAENQRLMEEHQRCREQEGVMRVVYQKEDTGRLKTSLATVKAALKAEQAERRVEEGRRQQAETAAARHLQEVERLRALQDQDAASCAMVNKAAEESMDLKRQLAAALGDNKRLTEEVSGLRTVASKSCAEEEQRAQSMDQQKAILNLEAELQAHKDAVSMSEHRQGKLKEWLRRTSSDLEHANGRIKAFRGEVHRKEQALEKATQDGQKLYRELSQTQQTVEALRATKGMKLKALNKEKEALVAHMIEEKEALALQLSQKELAKLAVEKEKRKLQEERHALLAKIPPPTVPEPRKAPKGKKKRGTQTTVEFQAAESGVEALPKQPSDVNVPSEDEEVETPSSAGPGLLTQVSWSKVDGKWDGGGPYWRSQLWDSEPVPEGQSAGPWRVA